ncbi:MAG TPA: phosphotransferase [Gaiellaceae bacterium]|nr:phosphotransferase [Gaiellaceae bacterium]
MIEHGRIDEEALAGYVVGQRWYGSKTREPAHVRVVDEVPLRTSAPPLCSIALAEVRFHEGTHDMYQLPLGARPVADGWREAIVDEADGWTVYDALVDPELARELLRLMRADTTVEGAEGTIELRRLDGADLLDRHAAEPRSVAAEQSNSSVVFGDELILKVYRRLEAGVNPELELLRFLTARGFEHVAALVGWYAYSGVPLDATLGVLQRFVAGVDGWELALDAAAGDPEPFLAAVGRLGEVTGAMHSTLASDPSDPSFAPEESSVEALGLLVASVDEQIDRAFADLPGDVEALAPIAGRGEEVREQLRTLSRLGSMGRVIRHHGDYHLGQVLWTGDDWIVIDFEGEPARSLSERRQKRSPLRDVAGMLRSFAYVASAAPILRGIDAPPDFEQRAREAFLAGYRTTVDPSLLPSGEDAIARLLSVFELEKAIYELRYELDNRPDWVVIPVRGIERLLQARVP